MWARIAAKTGETNDWRHMPEPGRFGAECVQMGPTRKSKEKKDDLLR